MTVDEDQTGAAGGESIWRAPYVTVTVANLTVVALVAFDGLAIVAALPSITDDLGDVALVPWVITGFLATSAIAGLAAGPVIDAVGVRRTFRVTGLWFLLTSVLVAVAPNMETLIAARVLQGFGGGLVIAVALAAVGLAYPVSLRPRAFAANSMVWGTLGFGGPVIVAGLLAIGSWRLVFLAQIPLTVVALAMGWRSLPSTRDKPIRIQIDWYGVGLITGLVMASLVGVASIGSTWTGAAVGVVIAAACGALLWHHSGRHADPVLARVHLTRFPLRRIHVTSGMVLIAGLAADNYLPLYTRTVKGWSESAAAFSVMFLTIGWTAAAFVVSRALGRRTEAELILFGSLFSVPSLVIAAIAVLAEWPTAVVLAAYFAVGLSIGFVSTSGLNLLQSSSAPAEMGRTNSAHQFIRTLCITYGVAIGGAVLLFVVDRQAGDVEVVRDLLGGDDAAVDPSTIDGIRDGFAAIHIFSVAAAVACVVAAVVLWRQSRDRTAEAAVVTPQR